MDANVSESNAPQRPKKRKNKRKRETGSARQRRLALLAEAAAEPAYAKEFVPVEDNVSQTLVPLSYHQQVVPYQSLNKPASIDSTSTMKYFFTSNIPPDLLRNSVLGPNMSNIQYLTKETGMMVTFRGRGSGFLEEDTGRESDEPPHLLAKFLNIDEWKNGEALLLSLVDSVEKEFAHLQPNLNIQAPFGEMQNTNYNPPQLATTHPPWPDMTHPPWPNIQQPPPILPVPHPCQPNLSYSDPYQFQRNFVQHQMIDPVHSTFQLNPQHSLLMPTQNPSTTQLNSHHPLIMPTQNPSTTQLNPHHPLIMPTQSQSTSHLNTQHPLIMPTQSQSISQLNPQHPLIMPTQSQSTSQLNPQHPLIMPSQSTPFQNLMQPLISALSQPSMQQHIAPTLFAHLENIIQPLTSVPPLSMTQQPNLNSIQYASLENLLQSLISLAQNRPQLNMQYPLTPPNYNGTFENLIQPLISALSRPNVQQPQISQTQFASLENLMQRLISVTTQPKIERPQLTPTQYSSLENMVQRLIQSEKMRQNESSSTQIETIKNMLQNLISQQKVKKPQVSSNQSSSIEKLIEALKQAQSQQYLQHPEITKSQNATLKNFIENLLADKLEPKIQQQSQSANLENLIKSLISNKSPYLQQPKVNQTPNGGLEKLINRLIPDRMQSNLEEPNTKRARVTQSNVKMQQNVGSLRGAQYQYSSPVASEHAAGFDPYKNRLRIREWDDDL